MQHQIQNYQTIGAASSSSEVQPPVEAQEVGLAIDFGMTGSSATFFYKDLQPITWLFRPGEIIKGVKIPTTISYDEDGIIDDWGFPPGGNQTRAHSLFKSLLDPEIWNQTRAIGGDKRSGLNSWNAAKNCVKDYLTVLLEAALREISDRTSNSSLVVNLISTHPTTWKAATVEDYRNLTIKAFKKATRLCNPSISLWLNSIRLETESHAAGIFMFGENNSFIGDETSCFYILDVGGATTDPAFLQTFQCSSRPPILKAVMNPPVPGLSIGCTDIDSRFADFVTSRLRSKWEQENPTSNIDEFPSLLMEMASKVKALTFDSSWTSKRNKYSGDATFPSNGVEISIVWPDRETRDDTPQTQLIYIKRNDMEAIFSESLVKHIHELVIQGKQILKSKIPGQVCAQCIRGKFNQDNKFRAVSMGAISLVDDEVRHLRATIKVGVKKSLEDNSDVVILAGEEVGTSSSPLTLAFSHTWKQRQSTTLLGQFVLYIDDYLPSSTRKEKWTLRSAVSNTDHPLGLQLFKSIKYRICLTLPTTTIQVTPINFSAFLVTKDGQETRIKFTAEKEKDV